MRQCGECAACCTAAEVRFPTSTKPARTPCLHVLQPTPGCAGRCGIHAGPRPAPCSDFSCAWLQGAGIDAHRPDRTGLLLSTNVLADGRPWGFALELEQGAALGKGRQALAAFARDLPVPVIVCSYEKAPPHDTGDRVVVTGKLLDRCRKLIGERVERLTPGIVLYELVNAAKEVGSWRP